MVIRSHSLWNRTRTLDAEPASKVAVVQTARPPEKSIAVLPFDNQNRDPDTEYLSDGIPESIINSLSQLPQLRVMARSSVFQLQRQRAIRGR